MAYIQPQLKIFQEFEAALTTGITPLYACIIGPQYGVHTGTTGCESLGAYDRTTSTTYSWPDKSAGSTVEQDTVVVNFTDAILRYYSGTGFSVPAGEAAGSNKIRAASLILKTANGYSRTAGTFGTRDVAVGDRVSVTWDANVLSTRVAGFDAETVATVGTATASTSNQDAAIAVAPAVDSQTIADIALTVSAGGTYDGLDEGEISDTYTVTVTKAGTSGIAEASVVSTSGTDDVSLVTVNYTSTAIGTRGITCSLVNAESSSSSGHSSSSQSESNSSITESSSSVTESVSSSSDNDYNDLQIGDTWVMSATQLYVKPTPVAGGTFSGATDTTYIYRIVQGGVVGTDNIIYDIITNNGYDVQSNTVVSTAGATLVGNYGVTMTLASAAQYCGGDSWSVSALASADGAVRTILLADKLVVGSEEAAVGDALSVTISLVDDVVCPSIYYTTAASSIVMLGSAEITGTYLGTSAQFPVLNSGMCVEYRELLTTNTTSINTLSDPTEVAATLGTVSTDNPLAKGVYSALLNSNGTPVYYIGTASDDLAGYTTALDTLSSNQDVYSLVPMTKLASVITLLDGHVDAQSAATKNNWRIGWVNSNEEQSASVYIADASGEDLEATVTDPSSGTNYTKATLEDGLFITNGVVAGDVLRINYRPYAGETIYDTAVIDSVDTEEELTLVTALSSEYPIAVKIEVYSTLTLTQYATAIGQAAGTISNRRMYYVWPDTVSDGTASVSGIYLCAALAGLRSGVAPHAPLTNVSVTGFATLTRSLMFNATQLNIMAGNGVWIVTKDLSGTVYTRHQVSTDNTDINMREQTITTNLDSISRIFRDGFSDIIGRGNVSADMIDIIRTRTHSTAEYIEGLPYSLTLGPQLQDYEITRLEVDAVLRDHIWLTIEPTLPYPLNNLSITMLIS